MKTALPLILCLAGPVSASAADAPPIQWMDWDAGLFPRAAREHRFVLLDLEAVWCHWCHVMAETTYRDPAVVGLIQKAFLPVRVDQDARPDLSNRYEDYGWPATVILDAGGHELVTFAGYIPPGRMAGLLQGVIDDPTPGPSVARAAAVAPAREASLEEGLKKELEEAVVRAYDPEHGGWGFVHKYLTARSVEYSLGKAREGDEAAGARARQTLERCRLLLDPEWGGMYQYSDGGVWENPHFEKIMSIQAEALQSYALSYSQGHAAEDLRAAREVRRFLDGFLKTPEGAFQTSQDADLVPGEHASEYFASKDAERRRRGLPRIDTHLYARENAWAGLGLLALYRAAGEADALAEARTVAEWIVAHRSRGEGGFGHDAVDKAGPYLGDTLAAGRLFLGLYSATAERAWLGRAEGAARFIQATFRSEAGFLTAAGSPASSPERDETVELVRFLNLLHEFTGQSEYREMAEHGMRFLGSPGVAGRFETAGVLLADAEMRQTPLHVTIVGHKDDPVAQELLRTALAIPVEYKRVELWDRRDGPLPRPDTPFPELSQSAAYLCAEGRCSAPAKTADALESRIARLGGPSR
jgi:uncharacterized protein YyaL (SSP411 family)